MFSVAIKHMTNTGKILASRCKGASGGTMKPVRKHYELAMSYNIDECNGNTPTTIDAIFPSDKYEALDYTPIWIHHRFYGWFSSAQTPSAAIPSTDGQIVAADSVVYERPVVYARWQLPCTVVFDATSQGGQMPSGWTAPDYYAGQPYGVLPTPTKSGQVFIGWYNPSGTKITETSTVPQGGTTLTARYMAVNYTTTYTCTTNRAYRNTGIYSANRYSSSNPIVVEWGDGSIDVVDGNISQLAHTYSSNNTFTVRISDNISSLMMSYNNSTWYDTTSQNRYTLRTVTALDSKISNYSDYAFYYCSSLTNVVFPSNATSIPAFCFYYCQALHNHTIPSSCTSIGSYAFAYCNGGYLTAITIPSSVNTIGTYAFYYCYYLTSITFASGGNLSLNSYAFSYCGYSSAWTIDLSPRTCTSIPNRCFYYCRGLKGIQFPAGLTTIAASAFRYCWSLSASASGTVVIPEGVTSFTSTYTFANCTQLTEITLPTTLAALGGYAFYYCSNLHTIRANSTTAPTVSSGTFGNSAAYYTGRTAYSAGTNRLYVPTGATGYDASYWASVLLDSTKCGFTKEEVSA